MTASECLRLAKSALPDFQWAINAFIDDFRRATPELKKQMVEGPIRESGELEGLVAAAVSTLCREAGIDTPEWTGEIHSPTPFFAFPARTFALRVRLMLESPAAFRIRNVFVPENYLSRA